MLVLLDAYTLTSAAQREATADSVLLSEMQLSILNLDKDHCTCTFVLMLGGSIVFVIAFVWNVHVHTCMCLNMYL